MAAVGIDRYDLDARLKPALLASLPVAVTLAVWFGAAWPTITAAISIASLCGLTYLLSRMARIAGREVQRDLVARLGALPTTIMLRHRDTSINPLTKERYHKFLRGKGLAVPTAAEEKTNPIEADARFASCGDHLREMTRDKNKYGLIFQENIDFGYRRNLLGLRSIALAILVVLIFANGLVVSFRTSTDPILPWPEIVLEACLILVLPVWFFGVTMKFVADAAWSYAARLLASCEPVEESVKKSTLIMPTR